ncbi:hypothetical protein [uncultured Nitratireductor sp.]|uniref:hypothetical protein n=1 Tax=uncultured Nitratireductor sp. TaxID=520953 RepID=UPI0025E7CFAB|nr:hypothetical protein [uncultured Nitratireductor sp.]
MTDAEPRVDGITASDPVSTSVLVSLIGAIASKGVLSDYEVRKIYKHALFLLESHQSEQLI